MSLGAAVHTNGQRLVFLNAVSITTNVSATSAPSDTGFISLEGSNSLTVEAILAVGGAGGTVDVYIQTSLDGGSTWIDIMNFHFTTSSASKVSKVSTNTALAAGTTPGAQALSANTILDGCLGDRFRARYLSAGTAYSAGTTLTVMGVVKG